MFSDQKNGRARLLAQPLQRKMLAEVDDNTVLPRLAFYEKEAAIPLAQEIDIHTTGDDITQPYIKVADRAFKLCR